jgi:hypothetical protein
MRTLRLPRVYVNAAAHLGETGGASPQMRSPKPQLPRQGLKARAPRVVDRDSGDSSLERVMRIIRKLERLSLLFRLS